MKRDEERGTITIHFMDGTKMRIAGPKQAKDNWDSIRKQQLVLDRPYLCFVTEDSAVVIPMANVKYVTMSPKPPATPEFYLTDIRIIED